MTSDKAYMPYKISHRYVRNISSRLTEDVRNGSTKCSCPEVGLTENLGYSPQKCAAISVSSKNLLHPSFSKVLHSKFKT